MRLVPTSKSQKHLMKNPLCVLLTLPAEHLVLGVTETTIWMIFDPFWLLPPLFTNTCCRYTFFIVLYPMGVTGELLTIYAALPYVQKTGLYSVTLPNKYNFSFDYYTFLILIMMSYIPRKSASTIDFFSAFVASLYRTALHLTKEIKLQLFFLTKKLSDNSERLSTFPQAMFRLNTKRRFGCCISMNFTATFY